MDDRIRAYAHELYMKAFKLALQARGEEIASLKKEMGRRGMGNGFSGIEYGGMIKLHAKFTGRDMMARLTSYREAFEHAGATPSTEDFEEISLGVKEVYERGLQSSVRSLLRQYTAQRGDAHDPTKGLTSAVAHHYDQVLEEWKVWRGRVNLVGINRETFAIQTVPSLEKLPHKKDLLDDLSRLLSTGQQIAVLFIDLDNFKAVNDTISHEEGDRCLEKVAHIIGSAIVEKGRPYRYAKGDEFMAVLPNFDETEATATAERIRSAIDAENPGGTVKVTASIGVVVADQTTHKSAEDVLKGADQAMYRAKRTKNSVFVLNRGTQRRR